MQIGIEISTLDSKNTGTSRYVKCLINSLKNSGNNVIPFSPPQNIISDSFKKVRKSGIYRNFYRHFFLAGEMNKHNLDCAFFPDYIISPGFNKKSVLIIHDLSFISHPHFYSKYFVKYYTKQLKESLKKDPVIGTVSKCTKSAIIKELNIKEENIFLLQAYKNPENNFDELTGNNFRPYLLYVGHIEPRKNLKFLIDNFLKWKKENHTDLKLILAGEIWIRSAEIKMMLDKYSCHPDIEFKGYVSEYELNKLYSNASGFVHTSFVEGFGFPVLDAMHFNLPIICTENTAADEITNGQAITINPNNNKSLLKAFNILYEYISQKNMPEYSIKYSGTLMRQQLESVLDRLEVVNGFYVHESISHINNIENAIEKTLLYSSIFNSGINENKIYPLLFYMKTSPFQLNNALFFMEIEKKIKRKNGSIFLNRNTYFKYSREKKSAGKKNKKKLIKYLNKIPFVSAIAFSGGSAHYGNAHDDIDLFIITKSNAVYLVYFIIHLGSLLLNARKEICANYLIDENELEIKTQKDIYTAHQIVSLVPFKNKNLMDNFIFKNSWVKEYFPNFSIDHSIEKKSSRFYLILKPANKIIKILYRIFYKDLLQKFSGTGSLKIEDHILKLHTNDNRSEIMNCFAEAVDSYFSSKEKILTTGEDFLIEKKTAVNF